MRKIALVGTAGSGAKAPYHDKSYEIWGVSARGDYVTRADRWFELHRLDGEPEDWANLWRASIKKFSKDIPEFVMMYPEDLAPNVIQYPLERITARFGTFFMTSTFAWMMALAIDELQPLKGKKTRGTIGIWGIDMEYATEYRQQRTGFRHFIDLARFAGITVERLVDGGLAYEPVPYPMWQDDPLLAKNALRRTEAHNQLEEWKESLDRTHTMMAQNQALIAEIKELQEKGFYRGYVSSRITDLEKEYKGLAATANQIKEDIAAKRGQFEEQCWLNDYLQP